ncbi:MAG TPA: hypothetical protein PLH70_00635 [Bacteroidales bacterium]|nr:hypothetical protein [Bacteroidales bacterium]HOH22547.1 hypothetical protein [Bacteroidales bacterium]HPB58037.1 hypothetical protein [Bacteroidales bacterium]HPZ02826.1 hypothetical protein [Bacteroidales bacterium]HQB74291.1 hypothetical protein [Bacteroidales bacterium]
MEQQEPQSDQIQQQQEQPQYIDPQNPFEPQNKPRRPGLLLFLAILTFIGSGWSFLYYLIFSIAGPRLIDSMMSFASTPQIEEMFLRLGDVPQWQFLLLALFYLGSIIGAAFMLKLRRIGFYMYIIAQISTLVLVPFFITGTFVPGISSIIITLIFIGAYGYFYKLMS